MRAEPDALRELGERLERHIRFEERELFPMIEAVLPADELERLAPPLPAPTPVTGDAGPVSPRVT